MRIENRMSSFFDDKHLLTPMAENGGRKTIDRLSILYPENFLIDQDEKKIYGLKGINGEKITIKVMDFIYREELLNKLERIRKVCAASIALAPDELYFTYNMPVFSVNDIRHIDEQRIIKLLHMNDNMAYAMAKGIYCINFIDAPIYYAVYDYLTYEYKNEYRHD